MSDATPPPQGPEPPRPGAERPPGGSSGPFGEPPVDPPLPPPPQLPPPPGLIGVPGSSGPAGMVASGPGPVPLQPMGVGEVLDASIRLYRARWKTLMAIVAALVVPFTVIQTYAVNAAQDPFVFNGQTYLGDSGAGVVLLFTALNFLVLDPILRGAMVRAIAGIYLGERPTARESLRFALSKFWPLIVGIILSDILIGLGFVALLIPGVILWIRYQFVVEAVVVEHLGGGPSIGRSRRLTRGVWWHIFGTLFLAGLITGVVGAILAIPGALLTFNGGIGTAAWLIRAAFSSLAQVIAAPFGATVGVLLYFDARIRKEAFDLAVMAREVGSALP
jgi:hypothetical protein